MLDPNSNQSERSTVYRIIGGDQKEYGPVTVERMRQWIAEGRANGHTLARAEDGPWKPLSGFPEFSDALRASAPEAAAPTPAVPPLTSYVASSSSPAAGSSAQQMVQAPAICLAALGALNACLCLLSLVTNFFGHAFLRPESTGDADVDRLIQFLSGGVGTAADLVMIALNVLVFAGGLRMLSLRNYALCVAAAILALIPCVSGCCCCLGIPIGVWALVVLMKPEVKAAFQ